MIARLFGVNFSGDDCFYLSEGLFPTNRNNGAFNVNVLTGDLVIHRKRNDRTYVTLHHEMSRNVQSLLLQ